jgi:hypothetical protein
MFVVLSLLCFFCFPLFYFVLFCFLFLFFSTTKGQFLSDAYEFPRRSPLDKALNTTAVAMVAFWKSNACKTTPSPGHIKVYEYRPLYPVDQWHPDRVCITYVHPCLSLSLRLLMLNIYYFSVHFSLVFVIR